MTILLIALTAAGAPHAQAAAGNHDLQAIRIPASAPSLHDHAPGPATR